MCVSDEGKARVQDRAKAVGFIGLGSMGRALAGRLLKRHPVVVFDLNPHAVACLEDRGATPSSSPAAVAEQCDTILLSLPTSDDVSAVIFGSDGVASTARSGTLVIDQTTGDPAHTRTMASELVAQGVQLVDAPVSGGTTGAVAGTISIMLGAPDELVERASAILRDISPNVTRVGQTGAGHLMKLVNNLVSCTQRVLTLEAMALAVKSGVDPEVAARVLLSGGARNAYMERVLVPKLLQGDLDANFTLGLALKDVRLACAAADAAGVPQILGSVTRELYRSYSAELGPEAQVDSAALIIERIAGVRLVPTVGSVERTS